MKLTFGAMVTAVRCLCPGWHRFLCTQFSASLPHIFICRHFFIHSETADFSAFRKSCVLICPLLDFVRKFQCHIGSWAQQTTAHDDLKQWKKFCTRCREHVLGKTQKKDSGGGGIIQWMRKFFCTAAIPGHKQSLGLKLVSLIQTT